MARRKRLVLPDFPLHIIQRGNNRQACFFHDDDFSYYLSLLQSYADQTGCSVHAYVLMTNHIHLLITPLSQKSPSHLMKGIIAKPDHRIRHNNRTGRWLSTFMAQWHPSASTDLFVVGSMMHPRTLQIFDASRGEVVRDVQGESLTAVVSRCCFHPSEQKLISAGGNSSGRVTVTR